MGFWIEAGAAFIGWLITTAATIGYLKGRDKSNDIRFDSLEQRILQLEAPTDSISRKEYEARQRQLCDQLLAIARLAEQILTQRRR